MTSSADAPIEPVAPNMATFLGTAFELISE
jgi:hypothetical protein